MVRGLPRGFWLRGDPLSKREGVPQLDKAMGAVSCLKPTLWFLAAPGLLTLLTKNPFRVEIMLVWELQSLPKGVQTPAGAGCMAGVM